VCLSVSVCLFVRLWLLLRSQFLFNFDEILRIRSEHRSNEARRSIVAVNTSNDVSGAAITSKVENVITPYFAPKTKIFDENMYG